jgi:dihydrodipicolinate synthase/N-acetylneuraminate lyase
MPYQIGVSHMSAQISLERLKRAVLFEPSAVQVILPDWFPPNINEVANFLEKVAEVAHPIGLVLYNPPHAKKRVSVGELSDLAKRVPNLIGLKVPFADKATLKEMREQLSGLSIFIPGHFLATGIKEGAHGAYSNVACIHPGAAQWWYDLMLSDWEEAYRIELEIRDFMKSHIAPLKNEGYSNGALDKVLAAIGNWADIGTRLRWPYDFVPETKVEELRKTFCQSVPEFERFIIP